MIGQILGNDGRQSAVGGRQSAVGSRQSAPSTYPSWSHVTPLHGTPDPPCSMPCSMPSVNNTFPYSQNFPRISTYKQSCDTIETGESNWWRKEIRLYWSGNPLWKGNTSPQWQLEYNTYLNKHTLITVHRTLDLRYQKQYSMKESPSAKTSIERTAAREIFVGSNTSALPAASNPMASFPATEYNKTDPHKYKPHRNLIQTP